MLPNFNAHKAVFMTSYIDKLLNRHHFTLLLLYDSFYGFFYGKLHLNTIKYKKSRIEKLASRVRKLKMG